MEPLPVEDPPAQEYRPPTGWFVPPIEVDAPSEPLPPIDGALEGEPPIVPVTGSFVLPDETLAAWPQPDFEEAVAEAPEVTDDAPVAEAPEAPKPDDLLEDEAPHFLPEPSSEPLLPTAAVPIAPPPLVEPPAFGTSGVPKPPDATAGDPSVPQLAPEAPRDFTFEHLLNGEEPPAPEPEVDRGVESLFIEPLPPIAGGEVTETGSIAIVDRGLRGRRGG